MNIINNPSNPAVLFIPEAGIYSYMRGLAVLGNAIKKQGGRVLVTRDTGQMLRSPIMAMYRMPACLSEQDRTKINKVNNKIFKNAQKKYKFSTIELSELVDIQLLNEIDDLVDVADENLENLNFRGFPVGKIAQFDYVLETKSPISSEFSKLQKALYLAYIKNTALTLAVTDRICERFHPSIILTFNEYSQCQAVRYSANKNNVSHFKLTYPTNFNIDASRFVMWKSTWGSWMYDHCRKWNDVKDIPISKEYVRECWNDATFRMYNSGSHVFSSRKKNNTADIFDKLKLDGNRKTIVVYTSSQDERSTTKISMKIWGEDNLMADAFQDHIAWLSMLNNYAEGRDDIQIVVRIHPREGLRQFGFDSEHLKQLKAKFKVTASNFVIVWPDDQISSYDLLELADLCLVSWSSLGQEAARLGIPVLSCTGNMSYQDDDFIQVATTPEEYKTKLDSILEMKSIWIHLAKAVRFYHWKTFIPSLDLGETVSRHTENNRIWPEAPASKVGVINDILSGRQDLIEYNIKQWKDSLSSKSKEQESEAMRKGIRQFIDKIFYPKIRYNYILNIYCKIWRKIVGLKVPFMKKLEHYVDYHLEFTIDTSHLEEFCHKTKQDKNLRVIMADGLYATLIHNGKTIRRMSPMVVRLARLYNESLNNNE